MRGAPGNGRPYRDTNYARLGSATTGDRQYVWGDRYVDEMVLRDRDADANSGTGDYGTSGSGVEERLYALEDANFNVVAIAEPDGDVSERYLYYMAYGYSYALTPVIGVRRVIGVRAPLVLSADRGGVFR